MMKTQKILLDSNILIHLLHKQESVRSHIRQVKWGNCCVSEISIVELLYGAECSDRPAVNRKLVNDLLSHLEIIPFKTGIEEFCRQKALLKRAERMIEDNDLYIAATALALDIPVASENIKHLSRITGLEIQNWVER